MSKRTSIIVRAVTFICIFAAVFVGIGMLTGGFESWSFISSDPFGESQILTTKQKETTTQKTKQPSKKDNNSKEENESTTVSSKKDTKTKKEVTTVAEIADTTQPSTSENAAVTKPAAVEKTTLAQATSQTATSGDNKLPSDNTGSLLQDENGDTYKQIVPEDYGREWYSRIVVRRERRVSKDYQPDIVPILEGYGYGAYLNTVAAKPYEDMFAAAAQEGCYLVPYSAYRSYSTQHTNYVNRIAQWQANGYGKKEAIEKTVEVIMAPGGSEHNLGLAVDIICTDYDFNETKEYAWLTENAYKYGFIERYPNDSQYSTGVVREPWHWRYVGTRVAKEMFKSGLTFEEYLTKKGIEY